MIWRRSRPQDSRRTWMVHSTVMLKISKCARESFSQTLATLPSSKPSARASKKCLRVSNKLMRNWNCQSWGMLAIRKARKQRTSTAGISGIRPCLQRQICASNVSNDHRKFINFLITHKSQPFLLLLRLLVVSASSALASLFCLLKLIGALLRWTHHDQLRKSVYLFSLRFFIWDNYLLRHEFRGCHIECSLS